MKVRPYLVYVAGPYRAATVDGIRENIEAARRVARRLWQAGFPTICPHMNTAFMDGAAPDEVWLQGGLVILERCDAIVLTPGWAISRGAVEEREYALARGLVVLEWDWEQEPDCLCDLYEALRAREGDGGLAR